jgi:predicted DNA-binding protein (UPF0251 family)
VFDATKDRRAAERAEREQRVRELADSEQLSKRAIARQLGVDRDVVARILGPNSRPFRATPATVDAIVRLGIGEKLSKRKVAALVGVSPSTVWRVCNEHRKKAVDNQ